MNSVLSTEQWNKNGICRCCIEMVRNKSRLLCPKLFRALEPITPNYDTDCLNCARKGEYSSMWNIAALAYLLKVKVEVIYPAVSGSDNYSFIKNKRTTQFGKELFIRFTASAFRKVPSVYVFSYFPFGFEGRM